VDDACAHPFGRCKSRFTKYEFFKNLSLPLVKESKGGVSTWFTSKATPASIHDCMQAFTADENLQVRRAGWVR
jgi:hypothetical protein